MIHVFFEKNGVLSAQEKLSLLMLPPKKKSKAALASSGKGS